MMKSKVFDARNNLINVRKTNYEIKNKISYFNYVKSELNKYNTSGSILVNEELKKIDINNKLYFNTRFPGSLSYNNRVIKHKPIDIVMAYRLSKTNSIESFALPIEQTNMVNKMNSKPEIIKSKLDLTLIMDLK